MVYALAFCQITIGLIFATSFAAKAVHVGVFAQSIARFSILPQQYTRAAALLLLAAEGATALGMLAGGGYLGPAFGLATLLLLLFSGALVSALARGQRPACNCFGSREQPISRYDVYRNIGLLCCALGGQAALALVGHSTPGLGWGEWLIILLMSSVFSVVCQQLGEIAALLRQVIVTRR